MISSPYTINSEYTDQNHIFFTNADLIRPDNNISTALLETILMSSQTMKI